jgi:hypothetical protein
MLQRLFHVNIFPSFFILLAFFSANLSAATISGVVLNGNGQPLQGAIVHYKKSNIKDTTDNLGRYSITISAVSVNRADPVFSIEAANPFGNKPEVKIYDLEGRLQAQASGEKLNLFMTQSFKNLPSGTYFVQLGDNFHKVLNYPGCNSNYSISNALPEMMSKLAKSTALAADLDSLFFTAFGKTPQTVMLQPNQTQVPNVTLQGTMSTFHGYTEYDFVVDARACKIVVPKITALPTKPWIWRARFWDNWPWLDTALLARGYHLVYCDIVEYYGAPVSVGWWNDYYDLLTNYYSFNKKCVLEGQSRGGLSIFNFAFPRPTVVQAMYADAPVMSIKSWPGWTEVQRAYGFKTQAEWQAWTGDPIDNLKPLADAKVPIYLVIGDADGLYPSELEFERRYLALGGTITKFVKPGVGHVHGMPDGTPLVNFVHSYLDK